MTGSSKLFLLPLLFVVLMIFSGGCDNDVGKVLFDSGQRSNDYWAASQFYNDVSEPDDQIYKTWRSAGEPAPEGGWYNPYWHPYWDHY